MKQKITTTSRGQNKQSYTGYLNSDVELSHTSNIHKPTKLVNTAPLLNEDIEYQYSISDNDLALKLDSYSLEAIVELKIGRFFDQLGNYYPDNMYELIISKVEKPLIAQVLKRVGGNQVHAAKILGINRNTLRKKMKIYGLY